MKTRYEKILAVCMAVTMLGGMLTGCSEKKKEQDTTIQGRYVETEIGLPEKSGTPIGLTIEEGNPVLYFHSEETGEYRSSSYKGGAWSEPKEEGWLQLEGMSGDFQIDQVTVGNDGHLYAVVSQAEHDRVYRRIFEKTEDESFVEVTPEEVKKEIGHTESPFYHDIEILKANQIALADGKNHRVNIYQDGTCIKEIPSLTEISTEEQDVMRAGKETLAVIGEDGKSIDFYDTETFEKKNTVKTEFDLGECVLMSGADGKWYVQNALGIHRILEEGSIVETILDGSNTLLNHSNWYARKVVVDEKERFYGLFSGNGTWKLMQYSFDKKAPASNKTLTVYSLEESETIQQAVYEFQKKHPDVKVEYVTAVQGEEKADTEDIRTLNTELLGGKGADVLILDGLPVQSYIEKGVLSDITSVGEELKKQGILPNVIANTAQKDGKIYGIPARIQVPVLYGTEEEVRALDSLESLGKYADEYSDRLLFGYTTHDMIGMTLFNYFYDELQKENKALDEEKLTAFLTIWKNICKNGGLPEYEKEYEDGPSIWKEFGAEFQSAQEVTSPSIKKFVRFATIKGFGYTEMLYPEVEKAGMLPESVKGYYRPAITAGINASSTQQELAEEFLKVLFQENVQKIDTWEGLPVSEKVLDAMPDPVDDLNDKQDSAGFSGIDFGTGKRYEMSMRYPTKEEMKSLLTVIKDLDTPFSQDRIVTDIVLEELGKCYEESETPETIAEEICKKVDTYLAE